MIIIDSHKKLFQFWDMMSAEYNKHHYLKITMSTGNTRTARQNRAMHKWFQMVADEFNAHGIDFRAFYREGVAMPFYANTIKDYAWRPVQKIITGRESTRNISPAQCLETYEIVSKHFIENHGINVEWPTNE